MIECWWFSVLLLTIFSMKFYFQCQCTTHDIAVHRPIFAHAAAAAGTNTLQLSNNTKRMVRNRSVFSITKSFYSSFSKSNCYFWGERLICGCHGNCGWDYCSSCSVATAAAAAVAVATAATAAAATSACSNSNYFCPAAATTPIRCSIMQDTTKRSVSFWDDLIFYNVFCSTFFYN